MNRRGMLRGALALATVSALSLGCGSEAERRAFTVETTAIALSQQPNERGWRITLDTAQVSLGPVRFFEGRVLLSSRSPRFDLFSLIGGTAHAHPGHYIPGDALGELLVTQTVNLLGGVTPMGTASAVTGEYGSLELTLPAPTATTDAQGVLKGHAVRLSGTATHAERGQVRFDVAADLPKPVAGVRFEKSLGKEAGRVRISVDLRKWMDRIDFATATDPDADGTYTFPADSQAQNALLRGVEDTTAYVVTWEEGAAQ
ncbi:hypothetical protein MYSTI_07985 [Myxococcus stipitatus DSM 14675]|uniref:Lipoprotein n=1 Tax=Myxococcus stipitatus (strain DSM 14675 / JCM 12634 / Mx s8) TaxID=1278073 RepID=L7UNV9_MYXSD|nr:hypothetical protein [Myxococcus stipitatus]AGC49257.1 hypothetical protein MYSTI_07985 [Myxococcus stipitatus DSM 14675]